MEIGQTLTITSIISDKEKENIELRKRIRKTDAIIARTQRYIKYLENMRIQDINSIYH